MFKKINRTCFENQTMSNLQVIFDISYFPLIYGKPISQPTNHCLSSYIRIMRWSSAYHVPFDLAGAIPRFEIQPMTIIVLGVYPMTSP